MEKFQSMLLCTVLLFAFSVNVFADTHTIISEKPLYLKDGDAGESYKNLRGEIHISWTDLTRYGYFAAKVAPQNSPVFLKYEFILVAVSKSDDYEIEGLWDIKKNGVLVAEGIVGSLYGLNQSVGNYFKFYGGDSQCNTNTWHLSGYITDRFDF